MSVRSTATLQRYIRQLCEAAAPSEDAVLLKRFVAANDREAFELLLARHGPMVLGTARRLVNNPHDAEDVFQAVFLSFARLAKTIREGRALPAWLHRATCRVAAKTRRPRPASLDTVVEPRALNGPDADLAWKEIRVALDEELERLPERWRSPLILCYIAGLTRDEAAKQLGWSLGTLKRRLEQGRQALRKRLEWRGIASAGLALAILAPEALQAAVSPSLFETTLLLVYPTTVGVGVVVPASVAALALGSSSAMKGLAMKSAIAFLVAVGAGVGIYAGTGRGEPPVIEEPKPLQAKGQEPKDDPLPEGSTLRFGTSRFRHGIPVSTMTVSADGRIAVAVNDGHMLGTSRVFDLATGRVLYTLDRMPGLSGVEAAAISPDGRAIVTKQGMGENSLAVRDASTGKETRKIELPRADSRSMTDWIVFTPDGKSLAVASEGKAVHLIDFESGKPIRDFTHGNVVFTAAFSPDGKLLAAGGYDSEKSNYFARLWEVETGKELRRFMHGRAGIRSLTFSPDGKTLAGGGDDARLRLWEVSSGKEIKALPKDGYRVRSVAFAQDGGTVAAAGDSIRLYDAASGAEKFRIDSKAICLHFTDGGRTLTGAVKGAIHRWDAVTGKALTPESAGESLVEQVLPSADGSRIVTRGQNGDAHIWDAADGRHLRKIDATWQRGIALSPDGKYLAWPFADAKIKFKDAANPNVTHDGSGIRLYDIAGDKFVERFAGFQGDAHDLTFTSDGGKLVTIDHRDGMVRIWNVASGKEERTFQAVPEAERKQSNHVWRSAITSDGKTLAVAYDAVQAGGRLGFGGAPHSVRLWDLASGQEKFRLDGHHHYVLGLAFSPNGRLLATAGEKWKDFRKGPEGKPIGQVFLWDSATGKRVAALPDGLATGASAVAFSRDGRILATASPEGPVQLWETATWTLRNAFKGHRDRPTALAFSPRGDLLSGSMDTTVLAWDVRPARKAGSMAEAWNGLANRDASEAFKAQGILLATPAEAVKLLAERIKPATAPDAERIRALLVELDSPKFAVREDASKALAGLGEPVVPALEEAMRATNSTEARDRAKKIIEAIQAMAASPEALPSLRAIEALEWIGDGASKVLLKRWSDGFKEALLTREAYAALKRLEAKQ